MTNKERIQANNEELQECIDIAETLPEPTVYEAGDNILIKNNKISVITTDEAKQNNTKPITSAGVYNIVGNINALLETI